ncbi:MAG: cytochrome c oxidase assembly protein [Ahrensia sp.]|nr:cytochrome c oxidase assembly protein [Ahrensia sp.]
MTTRADSSAHLKVAAICAGVTFGMLGMAYAAVPLYQWFCQVTGYAGTTQRAEAPTGTVLDKTITIRFDANTSNELNWDFAPKERAVTLKIGEKGQTAYTASNISSDRSFGTATFNVTPGIAGAYFNKIECFCFTEQELAAGQSVDMPVIFFVDPDIVNDPLLKGTNTITLSYTFFPDDEAEAAAQAALKAGENSKSRL